MKSQRGATVRGSPHPLVSVHNTAGDMLWVPAKRQIRKRWRLVCRKQTTKRINPSPMAKKKAFLGFGRKAYDAAGKLYPQRPRIHLKSSRRQSTYCPCQTRRVLAVGSFQVEIEGRSSPEMLLIIVLIMFNMKAETCSCVNRYQEKTRTCFLFFL